MLNCQNDERVNGQRKLRAPALYALCGDFNWRQTPWRVRQSHRAFIDYLNIIENCCIEKATTEENAANCKVVIDIQKYCFDMANTKRQVALLRT